MTADEMKSWAKRLTPTDVRPMDRRFYSEWMLEQPVNTTATMNGHRVERYADGYRVDGDGIFSHENALVRILTKLATVLLLLVSTVNADVYRWDNGQLIPGTEDITPGPGVVITGHDLHFADLRGVDMTGARLLANRLVYSDMTGARLVGVDFSSSDLIGVNFTSANLSGASFFHLWTGPGRLADVNWTGAIIDGVNLRDAGMKGFTADDLYSTASYAAKNLRGIDLSETGLRGWNFAGQDLTGANFFASDTRQASFTGADLTDANLAQIHLDDVDFTDAVITGATLPNLSIDQLYSTANYKSKDLRGIKLNGFQWAGIDLGGQDLRGAVFQAPCTRDYENEGFINANFTGANVTGVSFANVCTEGANFAGAIGYVPPGKPRTPGDSTLDGIFNSADLIAVFTVGEYEDDTPANSSWEDGDWNVDGEFNTSDLVFAFQAGSYSPAAAAAVPEPTAGLLFLMGLAVLRARRCSCQSASKTHKPTANKIKPITSIGIFPQSATIRQTRNAT